MLDRNRFLDLWRRLGGNDGSATFERLRTAYSDPDRAYHNDNHIADCLGQFDRVRSQADRPDELELALWFHDAVYDTHASDNEERSAEFAAKEMAADGIDAEIATRIERLILVTKHDREPYSDDSALLVDIDLSILGRDPEAFAAYDRAIRAEYLWVPEDAYRTGRSAVLQGFLDRPAIFRTAPFRSFEAAARRNLADAIAELRSR